MRWVSVGILSLLALCTLVAGVTVTPFFNCEGTCDVDYIWYASSPASSGAPAVTTALLLTTDYTLYFSSDEGSTWAKKVDSVFNVYQSPVNPLYYVIDAVEYQQFVIFVTKDGGQTLTQVRPPNLLSNLAITLNPHDENALMIDTWNAQPVTSSSFQGYIYYTRDFGATWTQFSDSSKNIFDLAYSPNRNATSTIFVYRVTNNSFAYTNDFGKTYTELVANCRGFLAQTHFIWVASIGEDNYDYDLYISSRHNDNFHTNPDMYLLAEFPFGDELPQNGYTILQDVSNQGFIGLTSNQPRYGDVYISEYNGASWILSLPHVARAGTTYDFDTVGGVRGIHIANVVTNYQQASGVARKRTMITFDNGGEWRYLNAPLKDSNGNPFPCSGDCKLNLHGLTSYYTGGPAPFYSSSNAIGLIVAVGNVGSQLSDLVSDQSTFLSRDNGLTWFEIDPNPTIYEFGDHGGILVWARTDIATNQAYYSLDEGLTVNTFTFSNSPVNVENIITEINGAGRKFILYGEYKGNATIIGLDFSSEQSRICTDADYEYYSPDDGQHGGQHCLLGRTSLYLRRKRESQCYNDRDTDHLINRTACPCSFEDYECDWGWTPSDRNATDDSFTCTPNSPNENLPPTYCPDYYTYKTGYRVIEEDMCDGGIQIGAYQKLCPGATVPPTTTGTTGGTNIPIPTTSTSGKPTPTSQPTLNPSGAGSTGTGSGTTGPSNQPGGDDKPKSNHAVAIAVGVIVVVVLGVILGLVIWKKPTVVGNFFGLFRRRESYSSVSQVVDDDDDTTA